MTYQARTEAEFQRVQAAMRLSRRDPELGGVLVTRRADGSVDVTNSTTVWPYEVAERDAPAWT